MKIITVSLAMYVSSAERLVQEYSIWVYVRSSLYGVHLLLHSLELESIGG